MKLSAMILAGLETRPEVPMSGQISGYFAELPGGGFCADPLGFAYLSLAGVSTTDPAELVTRRLRGACRDLEQTLRNLPRLMRLLRPVGNCVGCWAGDWTVARAVATLHSLGATPTEVSDTLAAGGL